MSDEAKKPGLGLFLSRKSAAADAPKDPGDVVPPKKNVQTRWLYVGIGLAGVLVLISSLFGQRAPVQVRTPDKPQTFDIKPAGVDEKSWQARSQQEIAQIRNKLADLEQVNKQLQAELKNANAKGGQGGVSSPASPPLGIVPPPIAPGADGGAGNVNALPPVVPPPLPPRTVMPSVAVPPQKPATRGPGTVGTDDAASAVPPAPSSSTVKSRPVPSSSSSDAAAEPGEAPMIFKPDPAKRSMGPQSESDVARARISYKKNPYSGYLPAGPFAPVALLHGLDVGTSASTQNNPQPVLMFLQDNAIMPGGAKYALRSCFVLGSAYGDLSAERMYVRLAKLSCVDAKDRLVLEAKVQGYVVDSDGQAGLRGAVVNRQGAKLAAATLAGFAQGLGSAMRTAQGTTMTTALGSSTSLSGAEALSSAGLGGAAIAAQQLAQFYLREAQSIFPVITVGSGRTGTVVFSDGVGLNWQSGESLYQKEVKPESKN